MRFSPQHTVLTDPKPARDPNFIWRHLKLISLMTVLLSASTLACLAAINTVDWQALRTDSAKQLQGIQTRLIEGKGIPFIISDAKAALESTRSMLGMTLPAAQGKGKALHLAQNSSGATMGRHDPFQPLVQEVDANAQAADAQQPEEKDVLDSLQFTGLIDDPKPTQRVAMIQVNDPIGGHYTAIKRVGEGINVDHHRIVVKQINRKTLYLSVDGATRQMTLNPYIDSFMTQKPEPPAALAPSIKVPATTAPDPSAANSTGTGVKSGNLSLLNQLKE